MDTPEKNRTSTISFRNFEDSPVFQYINDLSPIEQVKGSRADNIFHSLAFPSPSSLFSSPQMNSYRDSRFSIKRHRSPDLPSPIVLFGETVKNSPDAQEAIKLSEEQLKCRPEQLENVSETKPIKEQISLAIELANSLKNGRGGCGSEMVSRDEVLIDAENKNEIVGLINRSDELSIQTSDPPEFIPDSDVVLQTAEMVVEIGSGAEKSMFDVVGIQNSEQHIPKATDLRSSSFASEPQQFSLCCNNSENVEDPGGSCNVQIATGDPGLTLSSSSNVGAIDSAAKAEDKEETVLQSSRKRRSVRRRCLTYDVGGSHKWIPLRDSTNDLPIDITSVKKVPSPQNFLDSSKQDTDGNNPVPQKIGLHLNGLVNPSTSSDRNTLLLKGGRVTIHISPTFPHNIEDEFSTPVSTKRDSISCDNKTMKEAPESSMEVQYFDKDMPEINMQLSQGLDELGSCKRCTCKKSKCLKLYCDCFAAGLYCVEPCSCQNCFNKPIHEDLVMKTRQLIEARNPLAFAPKVVSSFDSAIDFRDENNKTPASSRHTRGCNCKKSGCLKKYCECYLMGVGCSPSCRCVGCQNKLGHKNEHLHYPRAVESGNDKAKYNGDHDNASRQKEETSNNSEGRDSVLLPSNVTFSSLASL